MDSGGIPDGSDIGGDNSVTDNGVHHDPLNENLEETWSALGEQDVRSSAGSDPGMLPPPISVLPTSLGSIIGEPIHHQGMSELSVLRAPNKTLRSANIYQRGSEEIIVEPMAGRRKLKQQGEEIQLPRSTQVGIFGRKSVTEEVEADSNVNEKKKPAKSSRNNSATIKSQTQTTAEADPSIQKEEELHLDMFFQTMYNKTNKLSLVKQIELRREIRQLVMNAEKHEQIANRQKSIQESSETSKKTRLSSLKQ